MRRKHLSTQQHQALLSHAQQSKQGAAILFAILATTGIRADELVKIRFSDIDKQSGAIAVKASKRSHDRNLHLPAWLMAAVLSHDACIQSASNSVMAILHEAYRGELGPRQQHNAKQCLREHWRAYRHTIGAKDLGLHCLRHSVAMRMLEKTDNIRKVGAVLGHKNINNTVKYLEYIDALEASQDLLGIFSDNDNADKGAA